MNTTELVKNLPAAERIKPCVKVNNCGAEPENVEESRTLASVVVDGYTLEPRVMLNPRIVYATAEEWKNYDTVKYELAQFADDLDTSARKYAEWFIETLEARGIILRTRTSKARISNLLAFDLCENTANRSACENALVNRATTFKGFKYTDGDGVVRSGVKGSMMAVAQEYEHVQESAAKRAERVRDAQVEKFVASAVKMGMDADAAREFARAQLTK